MFRAGDLVSASSQSALPVHSVLEAGLASAGVSSSSCLPMLPTSSKNVPGRKGDACDAAWIADLPAHDLIRSRYAKGLTAGIEGNRRSAGARPESLELRATGPHPKLHELQLITACGYLPKKSPPPGLLTPPECKLGVGQVQR